MKNILTNEPAAVIGLVTALLTLLTAFGVAITEDQAQAILAVLAGLLPIVGGLVTRTQVRPVATSVPAGQETLVPVIAASPLSPGLDKGAGF